MRCAGSTDGRLSARWLAACAAFVHAASRADNFSEGQPLSGLRSSSKPTGDGLLCLVFSAGTANSVHDRAPEFAHCLPAGKLRFENLVTGDVGWISIALSIFQTIRTRSPVLVISREYRRSFLVNLALILTRNRAAHLILGMNLSARPIVSRWRLLQGLIDRIFARSTTIVVHSTKEAELFSRLHRLPPDRFLLSHWGYDLPSEVSTRFDHPARPYVCMIGRNNRDLAAFAQAVQLAEVAGVAIVPSYLEVEPATQASLEIFRDLPMADCVSCIRNALASVTLLLDGNRGAGHITVVTALHLGVAQIYSATDVLTDYFPAPRYGMPVPLGDAAAAAQALRRIIDNRDIADEARNIAARKDFARSWLSNDRSSRRIAAILIATLEGRRLPFADPDWQLWLKSQQSAGPR